MFQRVFDDGLAQASFLIACDRTREAAIVDPRRDIDVYVDAARREGLTIIYAIETHIHADFVSGARELSALGARVIAGPGSTLGYPNHEARDGERVMLGDITLTFLHTPGHTPEHISIYVDEPGAAPRVLTGDTLFVGAVGRPDLLGEDLTRQLAGELYDSLMGKLLVLDDLVEVHPGHGAGSLCGTGIGKDPYTTIEQERRFNPMLQYRSKQAFVDAVLADLPETPPYFRRMKQINHDGPQLLHLSTAVAAPPALTRPPDDAVVVDLRASDLFAHNHPSTGINLTFGSKVGYWAGWVVPFDASIVLVAEGERQVTDATRQLLRVGLDRAAGWMTFEAWTSAGLPVSSFAIMSVSELKNARARRDPFVLLDVRTPREFSTGHVDGARNVPMGEIAAHAGDFPVDQRVAVMCEGGYRSGLAASLLARRGVREVINVAGGMAAYRAMEAAS